MGYDVSNPMYAIALVLVSAIALALRALKLEWRVALERLWTPIGFLAAATILEHVPRIPPVTGAVLAALAGIMIFHTVGQAMRPND